MRNEELEIRNEKVNATAVWQDQNQWLAACSGFPVINAE
jgi:hypothetical protein